MKSKKVILLYTSSNITSNSNTTYINDSKKSNTF